MTKDIRTIDNGANVSFVEDSLITPLENAFENFRILDEKIDSFSIAIIFNKKFENFSKEYESENGIYSIIEYNSPPTIDGKQYNEIRLFTKKIKDIFLEQNIIKLEEANIQSITILIIYNRSLDHIKIKGIDMSPKIKNNNNEEESIFIPILPKYNLDQVILDKELEKEIKKALTILSHREKIYETWGFGEIEPSPKAILNFYGPSGTGKTMTAHAIANYLDIKIMALNYADIESKFVGDAPKNLVKAFEQASKENALLFFDEADSFLGKRITNISSSTDQAVNSLRSQMLILLENFEGIIIFATNLIDNYDKAFESRIFKHLKFSLPNEKGRQDIISKSIPHKVPFKDNKRLNDDKTLELAKISDGLSGRHIKNAILNALTGAVLADKEVLDFEDFYQALVQTKTSIDDMGSKKPTSIGLSPSRKRELENKISEKLKQKKGRKGNR